jgi:hypothetical protein
MSKENAWTLLFCRIVTVVITVGLFQLLPPQNSASNDMKIQYKPSLGLTLNRINPVHVLHHRHKRNVNLSLQRNATQHLISDTWIIGISS